MCSQYWTLRDVAFTCLLCGADTEDDLQTHYRGEPRSCLNVYALKAPVKELEGILRGKLGPASEGLPDTFIGQCGKCGAWHDFGATIHDGAITDVWPFAAEST